MGSYRRRRRARGFVDIGAAELVVAADLILRDGWNCWCCGEEMDPFAPEGSPEEMTLDHVIPVSDPRCQHIAENVRLAHRICNEKRNTFPTTISRGEPTK